MSFKLRPGKATFLFLFFLIGHSVFAQDQTIDSLKNVLSNLKESPEKVQVQLALSQNYLNYSIEEAVGNATAAKDLAIKLGYNEGVADAYRLLGVYYKKWGKYRESLDAYTSSLEIYKNIKDLGSQSRILNNFGS